MKGSLIVPEDGGGADEREIPQQVPSRRMRELIRLASAAMVLAASAIGLAAHFVKDRDANAPLPSPALPTGPRFVFGDLHSPLPRGPIRRKEVCTQEVRPNPAKGAWICMSWQQLEIGSQAAAAAEEFGPCSARTADQSTGWWKCTNRKKLVAYGDPSVPPPPRADGATYSTYGACVEERRASPTGGAWHCVVWTEPEEWTPVQRPGDPGGPCTYRVASQDTGRWECLRT
jgi:hypothetical protein